MYREQDKDIKVLTIVVACSTYLAKSFRSTPCEFRKAPKAPFERKLVRSENNQAVEHHQLANDPFSMYTFK
jgi:hypothetical protein